MATEYVTAARIKKRATRAGWSYATDRDHDGRQDATEQAEVDEAIAWAGRKIDYALAPKIEPADARGQQNEHLADIACDLCLYRLFTNGGDDAPQSVKDAFDKAEEQLKSIKGGEAVPGLSVLFPPQRMSTGKVPQAYMPR
jgi:hypothetical protein